ncbi:glycosyltransferase family 4 protein [bacterium]|nr:glycosyltransferase family 4 protein [bacterium]
MKILFFIESLRSGGKERRLLELIQYLKFNQNFKIVIVLTENIIDYEYVYDWNLSIKTIERKELKKDPKIFFKFFKICRDFRPDIIHTWGIMNTFYAIPTKLFLNIPLVNSMISNAEFNIKPWSLKMFFFKSSCFFSDSILSNSKAGIEAYNIKSKKGKVIYNGINISRFDKYFDSFNKRENLKITTPYIVVMVASVNEKKNYDLFIDVAKEVRKIKNNITFIGVGSGNEFDRIKRRISAENVNNVLMLGLRKDVEEIVHASDVCVLFTPCEGFPNSVMEYMASKKPVVVSNVGGIKELVIDNYTGFLVCNNDILNISKKITELIDDDEKKYEFGENGFRLIKEKYSIKKMSLKFIEVYKSLQ